MPRLLAIEPVTRIAPAALAIIGPMTFWMAQNTLVRSPRMVSSNAAPSNWVSGVKPPVSPALANRPWIGPFWWTAASKAAPS